MSRTSILAVACNLAAACSSILLGSIAQAQSTDPSTLTTIVVTARHLDESRARIQTQTGASTYTINAAAIAATPGGDNTLLNQVVMQAPDVTQDSFGQFHVRGEHNGLQFSRVNQLGRCASIKMAKDHAASGSCR